MLTLAIITALGVGLGAAWVLSSPRQQPDRAAEASWSVLSELLDLDYDPGGLLKGPRMDGELGQFEVTLDTFYQHREGRKTIFTRFVLISDLLPEGLDKKSKAKPSDEPIKRALAQVTRRYITELIKRVGATVAGGKLRWVREGVVWQPDGMATTIKRIALICEYLCLDASDQAGRLLQAYRDETLPDILREELQRLIFEGFSGTEECSAVATDMLGHSDPKKRINAAKALGPAGYQTLSQIGRNPDIPVELRESAIGELMSKRDVEATLPQLLPMLKSQYTDVTRVFLGMVRRHRYQPIMRFIHESASDFSTPNDKVASLVEVMGQVGHSSSQSVLLSLLNHDHVVVRRRVAVALGRLGSSSAVPQLEACANDRSNNRRFRELCEKAIAQIRGRHRGADAEAS